MPKPDSALQRRLDAIYRDRRRSEVDRLADAFDAASAAFIAQCGRDRDLARAFGDEETAVREQIKAGVMAEARTIFLMTHAGVTGKREVMWDD